MSEISQSGKCRVTALRAHIRLHMALVNAPKAALTHLGFSTENKDDVALSALSCGHSSVTGVSQKIFST